MHARRNAPLTRAFTLLELTVVIVLMSIVAVTVIPALGVVDEARRGGATDHVERMLVLARSLAMAASEPTGVQFVLSDQTASLVRITSVGGAPVPALDALAQPAQPLELQASYPTAQILSITHGDGSSGSGTIWFRFDGEPEIRDASGVFVSLFTQDAAITLTGSRVITVARATGLVEQP